MVLGVKVNTLLEKVAPCGREVAEYVSGLFCASVARMVKARVVPVVTDFAPIKERTGAVLLLTVTVTGLEVLVFPAASRAVAVRVWVPLEIPTVFHDPEYGAVVSVEMSELSMRNRTLVTPTLSEAVAERVTVEEMVPEGEVKLTVGRVVSGMRAKVAMTLPTLESVQVEVPVQPDDQPVNVEPVLGVAVSVILEELATEAVQMLSVQERPVPVIVPVPVPDLVAVME